MDDEELKEYNRAQHLKGTFLLGKFHMGLRLILESGKDVERMIADIRHLEIYMRDEIERLLYE